MKAIVITQFGGPDVLEVKEFPTPRAIEDEVLIKVKASGLNRSDILQRTGHYPAPEGAPAEIPGQEAAGIIAACGPGVTMWKPGDKVCALLAGGGYAEYVRVKEGQCLPVPKGWTFTQAGGLPETVFTVWSNVFERGGLRPGETLLVHGGSSGIGITAIQIAHSLLSRVIVTVGSDEKGKNCLQLGADKYINYRSDDFESILKEEGADVILDIIGGDYFQKNLNILRQDGRLIHINVIGGDKVTLSLLQVMRKRLTISGSTLRSRDYEFKKRLARSVFEKVWPIIEEGKFKPVIFQTFSYREAAAAHRLLEQSVHTGKIILEWDD